MLDYLAMIVMGFGLGLLVSEYNQYISEQERLWKLKKDVLDEIIEETENESLEMDDYVLN